MTLTYRSTMELSDVARRLAQSSRVAVTTHAKPDGDAVGCVIAMTAALTGVGKEVVGYFMPPVPQTLERMAGSQLVQLYHPGKSLLDCDLVLVVDTGAWAQVQPMRAALEAVLDRVIVVDHHTSGDIPSMRYVDSKAAACCEIVAELIDQLTKHADHPIADDLQNVIDQAIFLGVAADTGWFRFSNTRPQTHELAARLLRRGVNHSLLYEQTEQTERPQRLQLMARALQSMRLISDGQAAVMVLRAGDFRETGARIEETERFVDLPQTVGSVRVVALVTEPPVNGEGGPQSVRVSFRSKPGNAAVDVAKLAQNFGGGGHARAAGAKCPGPVDLVVDQVSDAIVDAIDKGQHER